MKKSGLILAALSLVLAALFFGCDAAQAGSPRGEELLTALTVDDTDAASWPFRGTVKCGAEDPSGGGAIEVDLSKVEVEWGGDASSRCVGGQKGGAPDRIILAYSPLGVEVDQGDCPLTGPGAAKRIVQMMRRHR